MPKIKTPWTENYRTATVTVDTNHEPRGRDLHGLRVKVVATTPEGDVALYLTRKDARLMAYKLLALSG